MEKQLVKKSMLCLVSLILTLIFVEVGLQLAAYFVQPSTKEISAVSQQPYRIVTIGESTTTWGGEHAYPLILERRLKEVDLRYEVINLGQTSANTKTLKKSLATSIPKYKPGIAILMVGINDYWLLPNKRLSFWKYKLLRWSEHSRLAKLLYISLVNWQSSRTSIIDRPCVEQPLTVDLDLSDRQMSRAIQFLEKQDILSAEPLLREVINSNMKPAFVHSLILKIRDVYGFYSDTPGMQLAKRICLELLDKFPQDLYCNETVGTSLFLDDRHIEAKPFLEMAMKSGAMSPDIYHRLARIEVDQGRPKEAIKILQSGIDHVKAQKCMVRTNFPDHIVHIMFKRLENPNLAWQTLQKFLNDEHLYEQEIYTLEVTEAQLFGLKRFDPLVTAKNFWLNREFQKNLKDMVAYLQDQNINVVIMQYPLRPVAPLKKILKDFSNISYVENKENFDRILMQVPRDQIFTDLFAKDFGHFSPQGAELVAEQAYKEIMSIHNK